MVGEGLDPPFIFQRIFPNSIDSLSKMVYNNKVEIEMQSFAFQNRGIQYGT